MGCSKKTPSAPEQLSPYGPIAPLPEQAAERDLSPPSSCAPNLYRRLPVGVELWSCYPTGARFVRRTDDVIPVNWRNVDQQTAIRYAVYDDKTGQTSAEIRRRVETNSEYADLSPKLAATLSIPPVSNWTIRGQLYNNGEIAGPDFFLIDRSRNLICDIAKLDSANPYTVCSFIEGSRALEVQFPNRLFSDIEKLLAQVKQLADVSRPQSTSESR